MCKKEKIDFLDYIVSMFEAFCPQMSVDVRYFVACQFALESNFGNSLLANRKHNLCGMNVPLSRISLNQSSTGFASYDSDDSCVLDYVYWLAWNQFNHLDLFDLSLFSRKLIAKKYCPEKDYIDRIYSIYNQFKTN